MQDEPAGTIKQTVDGGQLLEVIVYALDDCHGLTVLVLHHGILFQRLRPYLNLGQGTQLPEDGRMRVEHLPFANRDFQLRVESRKEPRHHILKTVEHGKGAHQRQRGQCHSAYRDSGDDIDGMVLLLGEKVSPGYEKRQVHDESAGHRTLYFSSSSIFSR